jgi:tagaturonate reductase
MQLTKENLQQITNANELSLPQDHEWQLPEKVLQFGTGVLLRGLIDYYINKANRQQLFDGRVVVVKSTGGSTDAFAQQDSLYTHCIKGTMDGKLVENNLINAAISRVLSAKEQWQEILDCAKNPDMQIIISNTTEVGITLLEGDNIKDTPPQSFPGKLLAFLYARYKAFNGSKESGMVIIPTELLVDNGNKLKEILLQLAQINSLEEAFTKWLTTANDFCNSLVDRIVPGALPEEDKQALLQTHGYTDDLAIMSEPYSLWAIETSNEHTKQLLSFSKADRGVVITGNIHKFRELKLRLLNATHTFSCGLAHLCGFTLVYEAMQDNTFITIIRHLMLQETIPCITDKDITVEDAQAFANSVINRFSNPFIQHKWLSITLQYSGKMKQRCVPLISKHYSFTTQPPIHMALGFAAYLLFMKATNMKDGQYYGERNGGQYLIQDDQAEYFYDLWQHNSTKEVVMETLTNTALWGGDLSTLPEFEKAVLMYMNELMKGTKLAVLLSLQAGDISIPIN